jgi:hypothetical protein
MTRRNPIIDIAAAVYILDTVSKSPMDARPFFAFVMWTVCIGLAFFGVIGLFCAVNSATPVAFLFFSLALGLPLVLAIRARNRASAERRPSIPRRDADFFDESYRNYRD